MHVLIQSIQTWSSCSSVCFSSLSGVSDDDKCVAACVNLNDPSLFWPVCEEAWPAQCCCCATDSDRFCDSSWTARLLDQVVFLNLT